MPEEPEESLPSPEARTWGMLCHLAAFSVLVGVPLGNLFGPLVAWLAKKNRHEFVDRQGKEAINFQISLMLYLTVVALLALHRILQLDLENARPEELFRAVAVPALVAIFLALAGTILTIVASVRAHGGENWEYPFTLRLLK